MVIQKEKFDEYEKQAKETARKKLKELREANNLTTEELANLIHVRKSLVESLENGNRNITIENALQLAAQYNVSLDNIYGLTQHTNTDLMINILLSLSKVIRYGSKQSSWKCTCGKHFKGEEHFLYIVNEFAEYLNEVQQLEYESSLQPYHINYLKYEEKRKEIQNKYRTYLKSIFDNIDSEDRVYNDTDLILGDIESLRILQNTFMVGISSLVD